MFLLHREIIFCSRYSSFSIFNYPIIYQMCYFMMGISTWDRGCIFQCLIQKKFGNVDFSWVSWVMLLIWHYNNIHSGLKCVLFMYKLEIYKKDSLLIIFGRRFLGAHNGRPLLFWAWMRHCFWISFETQSLSHQTWEIDRYKQTTAIILRNLLNNFKDWR